VRAKPLHLATDVLFSCDGERLLTGGAERLCRDLALSAALRGFQQGWLVLVLSAATAVISCINGVVGTAILSAGSVWVGFVFNGMWAAVLLAGCYRLIPTHLALGLAGSMLAAYLAHTAWLTLYLRYRMARSQKPW
jgi:O-antigen/teichoic acid export membrane protein